MKLPLILLLCYGACYADDIASAAGQIFNSILPNLISNSVTGQQGNSATNTLQQIGTVVGGVVDYAKKKSYEEMLKQVQDSTSDEDLLRISEEMFNADVNNAFNYIQVNLQGKTSPMSKSDEAQTSLLTVPENVWNGPTIRPFVALFDNYHKNVIRPEFVTPNEETEQVTFINTILATGLHSWLFFAKRELDRKANYLGYIDKLDLSGKGLILKQHSILSETKDAPEITMFVGTSPELEMALYTLCFMARPDRPCKLRYNNVPFTIQTKTLKADNVILIDTAYPVY
ncbi:unnamed protein product [Leptidea sinapis]|uniref:EndoU domain-containing protein n=1 Tax=Leptidea sinapis TaxID=189913 RepID=A0A5E4Q8D4_9NEOP|nr:unnamed protein product [Leptidea sinapis]